jgi:hypothetical protein
MSEEVNALLIGISILFGILIKMASDSFLWGMAALAGAIIIVGIGHQVCKQIKKSGELIASRY